MAIDPIYKRKFTLITEMLLKMVGEEVVTVTSEMLELYASMKRPADSPRSAVMLRFSKVMFLITDELILCMKYASDSPSNIVTFMILCPCPSNVPIQNLIN